MELWLAALVFCLLLAGLIGLIIFARRKEKNKKIIAVISIISLILFALLVFMLLALLFLNAISSRPPDDTREPFAAISSSPPLSIFYLKKDLAPGEGAAYLRF